MEVVKAIARARQRRARRNAGARTYERENIWT